VKQSVIIVAGGKGSRMGTETPKQFLFLKGEPILFHTIKRFQNALPKAELFLVLPEAELARWQVLSYQTPYEIIKTTIGGAQRYDSVKAGLEMVETGIVGVHDAVRPLVSAATIQAAFAMAEKKGSAVPIVELKDSIREFKGNNSKARNRKDFCLVQTPQCFEVRKLKAAYEHHHDPMFTDDASVFEKAGHSINLVAGNTENIKITRPEDLLMAEALLP
jgi:2-C-methyl-D-erythritol 4-phosphate cytidylyltransferase